MQNLKHTWAMLLLLTVFSPAIASHFAGGTITYANTTGNSYQITLKFYRDCSGIAVGNTMQINLLNNVNNVNTALTLNQAGNAVEVTALCPGQTSRCSGGTLPGIQEYTYRATVNLAVINGTYTISFSANARNAGISTLVNSSSQSWYISTLLDPRTHNTSPTFLNPPIAYICAGQPATISPNATDADGDALQYSLVSCMQTAVATVNYAAGFSGNNPLSGLTASSINPNTGMISFTPTAVQTGVVCVRVTEFRNGVPIGYVIRDMQIVVQNCGVSNVNPVIAPIANQVVQVGQTLCIPVSATDANNNTITLTAVSSIIPPATFTQTLNSAGSANGQFCFTPTGPMAGNTYTVTINARDNGCPVGQASRSFNITVPAPCTMTAAATGTNTTGGLNNGSATVSVTGGTNPITYSWTGPGTFSSTSQTITGLAPGQYCVLVVDGNSCVATQCVTIISSLSPITATGTSADVTCFGGNDGSITVTATGGAAPLAYALNGGTPQASGSFTGLVAGTYSVVVTDQAGQSATLNFTISQPTAINLGTQHTNLLCNGDNSGSASVSATGGTGAYTYLWSNGATTATASGLAAGTYTVVVTDANGCAASASVNVNEPALLAASGSGTDVSCFGGNDGSATVSVSGGTAGYSYLWSNGATGATASGLAAGTYSVVVTDANGCTATAAVTVNEPALLEASAACTAVSCYGSNDGTSAVTATGGTAPYSYLWNNGATTAAISGLTAGTYSVVVTDANGCTATASCTVTEPAPLTVDAGYDQIIYLGYTNPCVTLSATISGGVPAYMSSWTDANGAVSSTVCPTTTTTYTITVVDANGCTATDEVTICVVDIRCAGGTNNGVGGTGQGGNGSINGNGIAHVQICHIPPGNPNNSMTKCIPITAVPGHLSHGDQLGACGTTTACVTGPAARGGSSSIAAGEGSRLGAAPNPFRGSTAVEFVVEEDQNVNLSIYDARGALVVTLFNGTATAGKVYDFDFNASSLASGMYYVRMETMLGEVMTKKLVLMD